MLTTEFLKNPTSDKIAGLLRYVGTTITKEFKAIGKTRITASTLTRLYSSLESHLTEGDRKNVQKYLAIAAMRGHGLSFITVGTFDKTLPTLKDKKPKDNPEDFDWHNHILMSDESAAQYLELLIKLDQWFFALTSVSREFFNHRSMTDFYRVYSRQEQAIRYRAEMMVGTYEINSYYMLVRELHESFMSMTMMVSQATINTSSSKRSDQESEAALSREIDNYIKQIKAKPHLVQGWELIEKTLNDFLVGVDEESAKHIRSVIPMKITELNAIVQE